MNFRKWVGTLLCLLLPLIAGGTHARAGEVDTHGALKEIFHQGKIEAVVSLDSMLPNPDLYAVGALADLAGEITIIDGTAYLSYPQGTDETRTVKSSNSNAGATLLVSSSVAEWQTVRLQNPILFEDLDDAIGELAAAAGVNTEERFPFLLVGEFEDLRWHVVDGSRLPAGATTHKDHLAAGVQVQSAKSSATLIGFYSDSDQGVFTHMGSRTHVHCVVDKPLSTGHVDHVTIPAGTTLQFPALH